MIRGIKNNNPGNIRISAIKYKGEVMPSADKAFKQFESMGWGYRAIFVLLYTYKIKHGLDTIEKMIGRYAPSNENDTKRYIEFVSYRSGIAFDKKLDPISSKVMKPIVASISRMENGVEANPAEIDEGWALFEQYKV